MNIELSEEEKETLRKGLTRFLMVDLSPGLTAEDHSVLHVILKRAGGITDYWASNDYWEPVEPTS